VLKQPLRDARDVAENVPQTAWSRNPRVSETRTWLYDFAAVWNRTKRPLGKRSKAILELGNYRVPWQKELHRPQKIPSYRLHKPSGQAVVTLNSRDFYLGEWKSPESRTEFERLLAEWLRNGHQLPSASREAYLTIAECSGFSSLDRSDGLADREAAVILPLARQTERVAGSFTSDRAPLRAEYIARVRASADNEGTDVDRPLVLGIKGPACSFASSSWHPS
jgi:hypothetical protein